MSSIDSLISYKHFDVSYTTKQLQMIQNTADPYTGFQSKEIDFF